MKLSLVFVAGALCVGCATGVSVEEPSPSGSGATRDASAPDAKPKADSGSYFAQDSGAPNDPPAEQDSGSGPNNCSLQISYGGQTCQTCMGGCCAVDNACAFDADCVALINCLNPCANTQNQQTCFATCRSQHTTGAQLFDAIVSCMNTQCANDCP